MSAEQQNENAVAPEQANCAVGDGSALVAQLVKLAHREHYNCDEDNWYGCPMSRGGCSNDAIPKECNCGAGKHNAEVDAIAAQLLPNELRNIATQAVKHRGHVAGEVALDKLAALLANN